VIPTTGETDPDQYYRILLTVTDSQGLSATTHVAWHAMNTHGALAYRVRRARRGFPWQAWPAADLPDEMPASPSADTPAATS